jgi:hypothetical protein
MARSKKTFKPRKSVKSGKKTNKRINENILILKKYVAS